MKVSRFLTLVDTSDGEILAWSSYTGALAKVDGEFLAVIDALRNGRNIDADSKLIHEMLRCGFIVGDDADDISSYGALVQREKQRANTLKLVIALTAIFPVLTVLRQERISECPVIFRTQFHVTRAKNLVKES